MNFNQKNQINKMELNELLSSYVRYVCRDRDESHGHSHMKSVYENSITISNNLDNEENEIFNKNYERNMKYLMITSWLHDVCDHKYNDISKEQMKSFILSLGIDNIEVERILRIIDCISYSKENKAILSGFPIDYKQIISPDGNDEEQFLLIRNIVSDADKLEALGDIGLKRCIQFTTDRNPLSSPQEIKLEVANHSREKLLRLRDNFMRTTHGRFLSHHLHEEFQNSLVLFLQE